MIVQKCIATSVVFVNDDNVLNKVTFKPGDVRHDRRSKKSIRDISS